MAPTPKSSQKKRAPAAKKASSGEKKGLPTGRVGSLLRKGRYARRVSETATSYLTAVLSYLTTELLDAAGKTVKKNNRVNPRNINVAVRGDGELNALLRNVTISRGGVVANADAAKKEKKAKKAKKAKQAKKSSA
jgi:histone H2A